MIERVEGMTEDMAARLGIYCESCHSMTDVDVFEIGPADDRRVLRLCKECRHMFADLINEEAHRNDVRELR